jgi:hypothetical protein
MYGSARPVSLRARTLRRTLVALATSIGALLACVSPAAAGLIVDTNYTNAAAAPTNCGQLGSTDDAGILYLTCGAKIVRYDRNGVKLADLTNPAGISNPIDVAPSPDGKYLYVTQGANTPRRLVRNAAGTAYTLDATWRLAQLSVWNVKWTPMGNMIATDGRGDIYVSNGSLTTDSQRSIAKYRPDGTFLTAFGDWGKEPGNWITNQDIAVSRDGRRVFVGENCGTNCIYGTAGYDASRITRYDFTAGGTYRFSRIESVTGKYGTKAFPDCDVPGAVHSVYSLALDYWDNLYATSTTCGRVQMYDTDPDPAKDKFVRSVARWDDQTTRNHYVTSDWTGRIRAYQWNQVFTPKVTKLPTLPLPALEPLPTPDLIAPTLTNVVLPATTTTQTVQVAITATDDRAVTEMQLAKEDGAWGPWQPFATPVAYELSAGFGVKGVYVRVRDIAGNESAAVYRTTGYVAPVDPNEPPPPVGDKADPVLTSIAVPALTATRDIQVTVAATDDTAVRHVRFANEDGVWSTWRAYAASSPWQLSAGVGVKAVYAQVRDGAGRESGVLSARTQYALDAPPPPPPGGAPDTVAPALTAFTLPAETTTQAIAATLVATDAVGVAQVRFANEDGNWTGWQAFATPKQWTLTAGFGGKLVYAQVRDVAGNESLVLSARTSYVVTKQGPADAADPALTAVVLPATVPTTAVTVSLTATDDVGVTQVRFANEDGVWGAWKAFSAEMPHTLTAGATYKVVYAQVRDAAGKESNVLFGRTLVAP